MSPFTLKIEDTYVLKALFRMGQCKGKRRADVSTPRKRLTILEKKLFEVPCEYFFIVPSIRRSFIISILTYISSLHVLGFSIRYPDLSKLHSLIGLIPGYEVPPKITK